VTTAGRSSGSAVRVATRKRDAVPGTRASPADGGRSVHLNASPITAARRDDTHREDARVSRKGHS
jgi:hypothetical protein